MNSKIEDALWKDYGDLNDLLSVMSKDGNERSVVLEERDKIRNELIKLEISKNETNCKKREIDAENKRDKNHNKIEIAFFVTSTFLSLYAIAQTFAFDKESNITSTLGRNILNSVMPKFLNKR